MILVKWHLLLQAVAFSPVYAHLKIVVVQRINRLFSQRDTRGYIYIHSEGIYLHHVFLPRRKNWKLLDLQQPDITTFPLMIALMARQYWINAVQASLSKTTQKPSRKNKVERAPALSRLLPPSLRGFDS